MIKKAYEVFSGIAVLAAALSVVWALVLKPYVTPAPVPPKPVEDVKADLQLSTEMLMFGTKPVTLVEFTDFQCPYCKRHASTVMPEIEKLPVSYVSVNFPLENIHPHARRAALLAVCGDGKSSFYELHKRLFAMPTLDELTDTECMKSAYASQVLARHKKIVQDLGVRGTPTFFLGIRTGEHVALKRRLAGGVTIDTLKAEIAKMAE